MANVFGALRSSFITMRNDIYPPTNFPANLLLDKRKTMKKSRLISVLHI